MLCGKLIVERRRLRVVACGDGVGGFTFHRLFSWWRRTDARAGGRRWIDVRDRRGWKRNVARDGRRDWHNGCRRGGNDGLDRCRCDGGLRSAVAWSPDGLL